MYFIVWFIDELIFFLYVIALFLLTLEPLKALALDRPN